MSSRQPFSRGMMSSGGVKKGSKRVKYPEELDRVVVMRGVKVDVIKPWIAQRVTELLGVEDDVLIAMIYNFLEMDQIHKSGGDMYVQLLTFLEKNTAVFMKELWDLLVSASENPSGVPQQFIDQKEADLRRQREIAEELKRRQQAVDARFGVGHGGPSRSSRWDKDKNEAKRDIGGDRNDNVDREGAREDWDGGAGRRRRRRSRSRSSSRDRFDKDRVRSRSRSQERFNRHRSRSRSRDQPKDRPADRHTDRYGKYRDGGRRRE